MTVSAAALERLRAIAARIRSEGGRALLVGGAARDRWLERPVHDLDVEVFGLSAGALRAVLAAFGRTREVGRSFPVFLIDGLRADFALPPSSVGGAGDDDFAGAYAQAARRRDLTINAIAIDPLSGEWLDPLGGRADLERRALREADAQHFGDDPLRGLRVARFAALFEMEPVPSLERLLARIDWSELAAERVYGELRRILLEPERPARAFALLQRTGQLRFLPEIEALLGVPQDPRWHPEGDVFVHTLLVIDRAAGLRDGRDDDEALMWAALCHDLGKPETTRDEDGRVRALDHPRVGAARTRELLARLRAPNKRIEQVEALVEHHLAPLQFAKGAKARAYRRLARRLAAAHASLALLGRVARADSLGRTTPDALAGRAPDCDHFEAEIARLGLEDETGPDVVSGRDLMERGFAPGRELGRLLDRCRAVQDETGWVDAHRIIERALSETSEIAETAHPAPGVTPSDTAAGDHDGGAEGGETR